MVAPLEQIQSLSRRQPASACNTREPRETQQNRQAYVPTQSINDDTPNFSYSSANTLRIPDELGPTSFSFLKPLL